MNDNANRKVGKMPVRVSALLYLTDLKLTTRFYVNGVNIFHLESTSSLEGEIIAYFSASWFSVWKKAFLMTFS